MTFCRVVSFFVFLFWAGMMIYCYYLLDGMHSAAISGNIPAAVILMSSGVGVDDLWIDNDEITATPLQTAIHHGQLEFVKLLLNNGAKVNGVNSRDLVLDPSYHEYDRTPMLLAVMVNRLDIVTVLKEFGADVNMLSHSMDTWQLAPIHEAAANSTSDMVSYLIQAGANVNIGCHDPKLFDKTPLYMAAFKGRLDIVELLAQSNANINSAARDHTTGTLSTPLQIALEKGHLNIASFLIQAGADTSNSVSELIKYGDVDLIARVIDKGIRKEPILLQAAERSKLDFVRYLITRGADINYKGSRGLTALHLCCINNDMEMIRFLIQNKADVDIKADSGRTSVHYAASLPQNEALDEVIAAGGNMNALDNNHATPLHLSVMLNRTTTAAYLVDHGADVNLLNADGNTVLHLLASSGNVELLKLLIQKMIAKNIDLPTFLGIVNNIGDTAIQTAIKSKQRDVIHVLVSYGAHANAEELLQITRQQRELLTPKVPRNPSQYERQSIEL